MRTVGGKYGGWEGRRKRDNERKSGKWSGGEMEEGRNRRNRREVRQRRVEGKMKERQEIG